MSLPKACHARCCPASRLLLHPGLRAAVEQLHADRPPRWRDAADAVRRAGAAAGHRQRGAVLAAQAAGRRVARCGHVGAGADRLRRLLPAVLRCGALGAGGAPGAAGGGPAALLARPVAAVVAARLAATRDVAGLRADGAGPAAAGVAAVCRPGGARAVAGRRHAALGRRAVGALRAAGQAAAL
ncbi:hypothetical protein D3C85_1173270 [compost metagenome]